jgi:glycosyltransferase involved in cell wall biosynthesis
VTQDPGFGGGSAALVRAFASGAEELGRSPELLYPRFVPGVDSLAQLLAARRLRGRIRHARSAWVVAAAAPYGYAAARSGRPFAAWLATSLDAEWDSRRAWLPRPQRLALALNAPLLRRLEREVLHRAAQVYAASPATAASLPVRARVLPIPVDVERFTPEAEARWVERLAAPTVVFVGRASDPRKNVGLLLAAFELLRESVPEARLRLVGQPPAVALPAGVHAAGPVASVAAELRKASLFVLPSRQEGFGIVVAEALAAGVPVLVTPCGGPEELVRSSNGGRVLEGFDPAELSETAAELLHDPARLAGMRRAGREYVVREHSAPRFRELLAAALRELDDA